MLARHLFPRLQFHQHAVGAFVGDDVEIAVGALFDVADALVEVGERHPEVLVVNVVAAPTADDLEAEGAGEEEAASGEAAAEGEAAEEAAAESE